MDKKSTRTESENGHQVVLLHLSNTSPNPPYIYLISNGLMGVGDYLDVNGIKVQIVHNSLEVLLDDTFSITDYLLKSKAVLCGISLNWHYQSQDTIDMIRKIKGKIPHLKIVLGGRTASIFAEELLAKWKEIDFIIKGDGELPMLELSKKVANNQMEQLGLVPNLVWRKDGGIVSNDISFCVDNDFLEGISFTAFELLRNYQKYLKIRQNRIQPEHSETLYFSAGRGCDGHCLFCAGSKVSEKQYFGRKEVLYYREKYVVAQLKNAIKLGVKNWNSCFDPKSDPLYYPRLFQAIRDEGVKINHFFDCFGLPTRDFVDAFQETFLEGSSLNISPESGSGALRKKIRSFHYTNDELLETLHYITEKKILCSVYFSCGAPFETKSNILDTLSLISEIKKKFPLIRMYVGLIDIEPGSVLFNHQKKCGVESKINDFDSLIKELENPDEIHYRTELFSTEEIKAYRDLLVTEVRCSYPQSEFLKYFRSLDTLPVSLPEVAGNQCANCPSFPHCFQD